MMERDILAVLNGLGLLVADSRDAGKLQAMRNYAAIMALCADLRRSAEEYDGTWNITMVISELENHMAAVAGLFPTWELPKGQHLAGAHSAISKLAMGTCFRLESTDEALPHGTSREHRPSPVSHGCCTEEIGTAVSLWNRAERCCSVSQHKKAPRGALCIGLSL